MKDPAQSADREQQLRDMNEALLASSVRQQELTEQAQKAEAASRESEARYRALVEGILQLVWTATGRGEWTWSSPQWTAFTGQSVEESRGFGWLRTVHAEDRERAVQAWREAAATGSFDAEYRVRHAASGGFRWFATRARMVPGEETDGTREWLGTSTDIHDLRQLQEEQKVMVAELQHRTRNLMAVVRAIAAQTMARTGPTEAFRTQFNDRLAALGRVQGLLSEAADERISIGTLVRMELDALGADAVRDRIALDGPEVPLRNSVVQTLALALHELATNARKHGALASGRGRLRVTWTVRQADGEGRRLVLEWIEDGGDLGPKERGAVSKGYGRELIERALPYTLNAETRFDLNDGGLRCTIDLPLAKRGGSWERV